MTSYFSSEYGYIRRMNLLLGLILLRLMLHGFHQDSGIAVVQDLQPLPVYTCIYTTAPPVIDGRVDSSEWSGAVVTQPFRDLVSCDMVAQRTLIRSLWDEQYLYISAVVEETYITASISIENQPLFAKDNVIEIFLDPDADGLHYYEYQINAQGTQWQLSLDKSYGNGGQPTNPDMIAGLLSEVHVNGTLNKEDDVDGHWSIEVAIPWEGLAIFMDPTLNITDQLWKVNFARVVHGLEQNDIHFGAWSCAGKLNMHLPETWGSFTFVRP